MNTATGEPCGTTGPDQCRTPCAQSCWQCEGGGRGLGSKVRPSGAAATVPLLAGGMHSDLQRGLLVSKKGYVQPGSWALASLPQLQGLGQWEKLDAWNASREGTEAVLQL